MTKKDATPSPVTDIKSDGDQKEERKVETIRNESPASPEKTEVKNAHASGDGSIGKEEN